MSLWLPPAVSVKRGVYRVDCDRYVVMEDGELVDECETLGEALEHWQPYRSEWARQRDARRRAQ